MELSKLVTETRNPNTYQLDEMDALGIVRAMNVEDRKTIEAVEKEAEHIAEVIDAVVERMRAGGRLIYCGAGTSGRLAVLDAVECVPTFGMAKDRVIALLAGTAADSQAKEEAEDDPVLAVNSLKMIDLQSNDVLIGVAASGRTPYVIGALDYAKEKKAMTVSIACNPNCEMTKHADLAIELNNGPEVLTGSTRLKAGTSQKMVLNMITTASMILMGKVYENLMVDVEVSNEKLKQRWINIVREITGCEYEEADEYYSLSEGNAKVASIMIMHHCSSEVARQLLTKYNGFLKPCLASVKETENV